MLSFVFSVAVSISPSHFCSVQQILFSVCFVFASFTIGVINVVAIKKFYAGSWLGKKNLCVAPLGLSDLRLSGWPGKSLSRRKEDA